MQKLNKALRSQLKCEPRSRIHSTAISRRHLNFVEFENVNPLDILVSVYRINKCKLEKIKCETLTNDEVV